ncbi:MAG: response regulator [Planctomycetota bacterium]
MVDRTDERSRRVYVVDDNAQNRELIIGFLDALEIDGVGVDLVPFASGADALAACEQSPPDLVLLDIMMPRLSGYQVCERLRALPGLESVPVLMLTALNESTDVERALEAGANDFLIKPVQRQELVARVEAHLAVRRCSLRVEAVVERARAVFGSA